MKPGLKTLMILMAAPSMALAQTSDEADRTERSRTYDEDRVVSMESERARLGNQRIQTEVELRAREEQQRLEAAEREKLREQDEGTESDAAIAPSSGSPPTEAGSSKDMSRTLEQLRSLGELKDAGYVTEDEFERIKQKILDSQL